MLCIYYRAVIHRLDKVLVELKKRVTIEGANNFLVGLIESNGVCSIV